MTRKIWRRRPKRTSGRAPGKAFRKGMSLIRLLQKFPDDATAEAWFIDRRWPNGEVCCPYCGVTQCADRSEAQDDAVPMPGEGLHQMVQHKDGHSHGRLEARLSGLDHSGLFDDHESQVGIEHEAT